MRRLIQFTLLFTLIGGASVLPSGYGADGGAGSACAVAPGEPWLEIVYRLEAGEERVSEGARDEAIGIVCDRLQTLGWVGGQVHALARGRIGVVLPSLAGVEDPGGVAAQIGGAGQLRFYDWEPNLIGPERTVGAHPGRAPPAGALRRANREWRAAGRNVKRPQNARLIAAGAFPNAFDAVRLASEQRPRGRCAGCSASTPRFYLFDRVSHELLAGPVALRSALHTDAAGRRSREIVLRVPVGTTIVFERPTDGFGRIDATAEPGWYALKDDSALAGSEIVNAEPAYGEFNEPIVSFGFTGKGRVAFQRVTRAIAKRGRTEAPGVIRRSRAGAYSGHFAIVFDGEVETRPIVNFAENPDGIDGRLGAQISGGFSNVEQARELASILDIGELPVNLALARQTMLR